MNRPTVEVKDINAPISLSLPFFVYDCEVEIYCDSVFFYSIDYFFISDFFSLFWKFGVDINKPSTSHKKTFRSNYKHLIHNVIKTCDEEARIGRYKLEEQAMSVVIETTIGDITVDLYLKERPNACLNFLKLCKIKYYNLCLFHKVERNFIAQTGDPTATGRGGESIFSHLYGDQAKYFEAELKPRMKHEKMGTLSMVNNGSNMNGSQFFMTLGENLTYLDEVHTVFGEVTEGFETLLKINETICDPNNRPYQDIRITHTVILHDPYDDPPGLEIPDASPEPTREMLETDYIGPDEEIDDTKGKNVEEIEERIKESEAKARATILEMVGDIPDAEVKPPENVLFVCKLNPVTTSEDLELIFSRFGPIVSCEVIKDKKSGESLQYAFIEFEKEEDCENAYFKMDNVLIDDRRIHVDFSQSVSKLNFNQDGKFSKGKSGKAQNFHIKSSEKKSDGYEMIFDMEGDSVQSRNRKDDRLEKKSSKSKKSHHSSKDSGSYSRKRLSNSPDSRPYKQSHSHKKQNKSKYSRSPSPEKSSNKVKRHQSRSPTRRDYSSKRSTHKIASRHDSSSSNSSASSSRRKKEIDYKKSHSEDHHNKKLRSYAFENSYSNDKRRNLSPSYSSKSRDSRSDKYQTSKYSSRALPNVPTTSQRRKKSVTPVSSDSHTVSPEIHPSKESLKYLSHSKSSKYYEKRTNSKHSSRNRSQSKSPQRLKHKKKTSHSDKNLKYKKRQESTSSSDSSDSEIDSQQRKSYKSASSSHHRHSYKDIRHERK